MPNLGMPLKVVLTVGFDDIHCLLVICSINTSKLMDYLISVLWLAVRDQNTLIEQSCSSIQVYPRKKRTI